MAKQKREQKDTGANAPGFSGAPLAEDAWQKNPAIVRRFIEQRPHFEQLCAEVAYTLTKLLKDAGIKIAAITSRAKTLESFLEKIERKLNPEADPFTTLTDFAGARVVCFYPDDLPKIEEVIRREFEIVEKEDKSQAREVGSVGYSAIHFLVHLGDKASGARYDDLKEKVCEIQVRTVLQDAWALFSHYLMYKHENQIPDDLRHQIHELAGALGAADTAFQAIRNKRDDYIKSVGESTVKSELQDVKTNLDSVYGYLSQRFRGREVEATPGFLSDCLSLSPLETYPTVQHIEELMDETEAARDWYFDKRHPGRNRNEEPSALELMRAMALKHPKLREAPGISASARDLLNKAEQSVERSA